MAKKRRTNPLWLVNRTILLGIWFTIKYAILAAYEFSRWIIHQVKVRSQQQKKGKATPSPSSKASSQEASKNEVASSAAGKEKSASNAAGRQKIPATYRPFVVEKTVSGSHDDLVRSLTDKSQIVLIFGKRGSGKSALGFRILENVHAQSGRPCFVLGVQRALLPDWISEIAHLDEVTEGGVVLVDEGAVEFGSRESMQKKNVSLGKMLATARHKDLTLLFITQNTGMIDKNVLSLADVVIGKEGSLLQRQMERHIMQALMDKIKNAMDALPKEERVKYIYIFSDDFEGVCQVSLPGFWSQKISKNRAGAEP